MDMTSRRTFMRMAVITTATLATSGRLGISRTFGQNAITGVAGGGTEKPLYCFPLLGDIHYDSMVHHDMEWVRKEQPGDERQIINYVKVTESYTPALFGEVSAAVRTSPASVPFVVQVGDLVEGLCGSHDLASLQFRDAFAAIDKAAFGAPFLITKGNHDITGPGAPEAYTEVLLPWLAQQGKQEKFAGASYVRRQDEDLFVFFDSYKPNLDWLEDVLRTNKARHVFFIVHQPVIPYNARANWGVLAKQNDAPQRQRLLSLLGQYRAIVLSGHLHKYSMLTRAVDRGAITQLAVSSVLRDAKETVAKNPLSGVEKYGAALVDLEPKFAPNTVDYRRELLTAEAPFIKRFEYADVPGYAMIKVYADRVDADIFISLSKECWKTDAIGAPREPLGA